MLNSIDSCEFSTMSKRRWHVTSIGAAIVMAFLTMTAGGQTPADDRPALSSPPPAPLEIYYAQPPGVRVETFLDGLDVVWGLQFAPDKRLFLTEKPGRIRVVSPNGTLDPIPWAVLPNVNAETRERGLFGVALHPRFSEQPWVYVMYTAQKGDQSVNRVSRFREVAGRGTGEEVLIDGLPSAGNHNGGRIRFGPDGMLYIGAGEAGTRARAQDLNNPGGSVLRIAPDGKIPQDNPFPSNPIWAYGLRNPQGLAFRPADGALFAGDHGPTGEWQQPKIAAYDELNIIRKGGNYGWPLIIGAPGKPGFVDPILAWIPSVPPGDLLFYNADLMPEFKGDLFLSTLWGEALLRIRFQDSGNPNRVTGIERWFNTRIWRVGEQEPSVYGRLRGMTVGPDGAIYVGTSNRDTRRQPLPGDDKVLRIVAATR
jgi:glucose/arabinose dehydrogenase